MSKSTIKVRIMDNVFYPLELEKVDDEVVYTTIFIFKKVI